MTRRIFILFLLFSLIIAKLEEVELSKEVGNEEIEKETVINISNFDHFFVCSNLHTTFVSLSFIDHKH